MSAPDKDAPSLDYVVDSKDVDEIKKAIREKQPDVIIGTKSLGDGTTYFTLTGFSRKPQVLGEIKATMEGFQDEAKLSGERPQETSMSDLIDKVRQARNEP